MNQVEEKQAYSGEREVDEKSEQLQCDYVFHMDSNDSGNLPVMSTLVVQIKKRTYKKRTN